MAREFVAHLSHRTAQHGEGSQPQRGLCDQSVPIDPLHQHALDRGITDSPHEVGGEARPVGKLVDGPDPAYDAGDHGQQMRDVLPPPVIGDRAVEHDGFGKERGYRLPAVDRNEVLDGNAHRTCPPRTMWCLQDRTAALVVQDVSATFR
jgi:hypothetical protein